MARRKTKGDWESEIELLEMRLKRANATAEAHREAAQRYVSLLNDLGSLEPSLEKYRPNLTNVFGEYQGWDFEGIRRAVKFREEEANAAKYAPVEDETLKMSAVGIASNMGAEINRSGLRGRK